MKKLSTLFLLLTGTLLSAQINVTFQLDMTGITPSADGIHIAGSLNGWNTSATSLTDTDGDEIYEVTMLLDADADYEYKFLNGNAWGTEEVPPMACAVGGNNRIFTTGLADMTLAVTPFSGCPTPNPTQEVTFTVDMSGQTVSPDGVHIAGNFNGWNPTSTEMLPIGNDFYQVTVTVLSVLTTVQYKYLNGSGWGNDETVPPACANGASNRFYVIDGLGANVEVPAYLYGTCVESAIILPVTLTSLEARARGGQTTVHWETASEINNEGFEVEHSTDGRQWSRLGFVKGNGTTTRTQEYYFVDDSPASGSNYYRLRQVDFDGQYEYSDIVSVYVGSRFESTSVYPNPVSDELIIDDAVGQLTIYNVLGQPIVSENLVQPASTIDVAALQPGTYILTVAKTDGTLFSTTLIK